MPRSNTSADESDAAPLSTSAIDPQHARAVTRQSLSFPSWDSAKRDEWQAFAMRVRAFVKRIGRRAIWDVAAGDRSLDEYDEDEDFKEADETLHCDLVLYVKGHEASEILQSSEDRFTDAWPKLMREFGAETSVRRMEIVRQLVTLNMDDYQHEMRRYKSACMELSRRVKEAQLSIDDVIIYSSKTASCHDDHHSNSRDHNIVIEQRWVWFVLPCRCMRRFRRLGAPCSCKDVGGCCRVLELSASCASLA